MTGVSTATTKFSGDLAWRLPLIVQFIVRLTSPGLFAKLTSQTSPLTAVCLRRRLHSLVKRQSSMAHERRSRGRDAAILHQVPRFRCPNACRRHADQGDHGRPQGQAQADLLERHQRVRTSPPSSDHLPKVALTVDHSAQLCRLREPELGLPGLLCHRHWYHRSDERKLPHHFLCPVSALALWRHWRTGANVEVDRCFVQQVALQERRYHDNSHAAQTHVHQRLHFFLGCHLGCFVPR